MPKLPRPTGAEMIRGDALHPIRTYQRHTNPGEDGTGGGEVRFLIHGSSHHALRRAAMLVHTEL